MPKGLQTASPATRVRVSSGGGAARRDALSPAEREASARTAANAAHSPAALARRIARRWPEMGPGERREVRRVLREAGVIT